MLPDHLLDRICDTVTAIDRIDEQFYEGYRVTTAKQTITLKIERGYLCCEEYGSGIYPDNAHGFVGAWVKDVGWGKDRAGEAVVDVNTNQGLLQLRVYNHHNGYYPHIIKASWHDYEDRQEL